jgi:hypothetical protein
MEPGRMFRLNIVLAAVMKLQPFSVGHRRHGRAGVARLGANRGAVPGTWPLANAPASILPVRVYRFGEHDSALAVVKIAVSSRC